MRSKVPVSNINKIIQFFNDYYFKVIARALSFDESFKRRLSDVFVTGESRLPGVCMTRESLPIDAYSGFFEFKHLRKKKLG